MLGIVPRRVQAETKPFLDNPFEGPTDCAAAIPVSQILYASLRLSLFIYS